MQMQYNNYPSDKRAMQAKRGKRSVLTPDS